METANQKTLRDSIDANKNLLSTMAVLAALFAFMRGLPIGWLSTTLSFFFVGGIVLMWFEMKSYFPKESEMSARLYLFSTGMSVVTWGTVLYWLLLFRTIWWFCLFIPLTIVFVILSNSSFKTAVQIARIIVHSPFMKKLTESKFIRKVSDDWNRSRISKILDVLYWIATFSISLIYAVALSFAINPILDLISKISINKP